jgi:SAM-dependent MidA family methyltransferase
MRANPIADILPEPPPELKQLSLQLQARMRSAADKQGFLDFATYMEMALYEPGLGYYSAGLHKLGAGGDFITAPELGSVFAQCLALQLDEIGAQLGQWEVLELGAGTGSLAAGLLQAPGLQNRPARYRILERSADLREQQRRRLAGLPVEWLDAPPSGPWQGVLLANEVVDALAVERFETSASGLAQMGVNTRSPALAWASRPAPPGLREALAERLGGQLASLAPGYRSECCTRLPAWLASVSASLQRGVALFIDYGYPRQEYYRPERRDGTLICHYRHRAHADPFYWPGLQDLSAFVDFTALAEAGQAAGLDYAGYTSQAHFLLGCGLQQVLAGLENLPQRQRLERAREVRELTLPGAMGEKFQAMALARDYPAPLRAFAGVELGAHL